ncbi:MAG: sialate O-acetylesterase [Bacteroidota bacterium]
MTLIIAIAALLLMTEDMPQEASQANQATPVRVFYLGGQSNMDGYGFNSELPSALSKVNRDVWIFHGNPAPDDDSAGGLGIWEPLQPGHGTGFSSDGISNSLSDRFGIELTLAAMLQELYPGEKIALIKYSRGGTSIDSLAASHFGCWDPDYIGTAGINQYDHFLKTVHSALSTRDIDRDGRPDLLIPSGIVWMQGESDAHTEDIASRYGMHLKRLMDLIRASFHTDDLPVVIGKISDSWNDDDGKVWDYCELVQYAQEKYVRSDANAAIVRSTRYYKYSDTWHYDSQGYLDLGEKFAEAINTLDH